MYPDEERVTGSSKFFHALIKKMLEREIYAIAKFTPRNGAQLRFVALVPQQELYD